MPKASKIVIISGERGSGKTKFFKRFSENLKNDGRKIAGIYCDGFFKENKRQGYNVVNVKTGEKMGLCSRNYPDAKYSSGPYGFSDLGLQFGNRALDWEEIKDAEILLIDEISRLELSNQGWAEKLDYIFEHYKGIIIISVSLQLLKKVISRWEIKEFEYFLAFNLKTGTVLKSLSL